MAEELKDRKDVPEELTWNLANLYETREDMLRDADEMKRLAEHMAETYKGRLNTPGTIQECLTEYRRVYELMTLTGVYSELAMSVDYYDNDNQEQSGRIGRLRSEERRVGKECAI